MISVTAHDIFDNRLDFGDNLLALKAIETERGKYRPALFRARDEIDRRRGQLIAEIEGKLE